MLIPSPDVEFGPWTLTDQVGGSLVVPYVDEAGTIVDLDGWSVAAAKAYAPDGTSTATVTATLVQTIEGPWVVEYDFPATSWTNQAGVWGLTAGLVHDAEPVVEWTVPLAFVVEDTLSGWLTIAAARSGWRDAPASDVALWRLLEVARSQVEAWAIPVPETDPPTIPRPSTNLVTAQGMQTRNIWNAAKTDPSSGGIGDPDFVIRPYPMDPVIKDIIRPKRPKPVIA